jgi:hypothetical protein
MTSPCTTSKGPFGNRTIPSTRTSLLHTPSTVIQVRCLPRRQIHPCTRAQSTVPRAPRVPQTQPSTHTPHLSEVPGSARGVYSSIDDNLMTLDVYRPLPVCRSISQSNSVRFCIPSCFFTLMQLLVFRPGPSPGTITHQIVHCSQFHIMLYSPSCFPFITYPLVFHIR